MNGEVPHLTAEATRDGRPVKLSHPLAHRTLDEARVIYKAFAPMLPPDVVWRTDLPHGYHQSPASADSGEC